MDGVDVSIFYGRMMIILFDPVGVVGCVIVYPGFRWRLPGAIIV